MDNAMFEAGNLPFGTTAVPMALLRFDFLEAIHQCKDTLPAEYLQVSWFKELQTQCAILFIENRDSNCEESLLYIQVEFLARMYRAVHGGIAPE
ncbi:hypothetical protein PG994_013883 [Apiospora phragmitis]|uniref:Uncharacterized protein n=1 Tax=Apiospora phragmitis TaxID=2905665 RepID=A0ABR1T2Q7_9PEZI